MKELKNLSVCPDCNEKAIGLEKDSWLLDWDEMRQDFYCPHCNQIFNNFNKSKRKMSEEFSLSIKVLTSLRRSVKRKFIIVGSLLAASGLFSLFFLSGINVGFTVFGLIFLVLGGYLILG